MNCKDCGARVTLKDHTNMPLACLYYFANNPSLALDPVHDKLRVHFLYFKSTELIQ